MTPERLNDLIEEAAAESVDVENPLAAARMEISEQNNQRTNSE